MSRNEEFGSGRFRVETQDFPPGMRYNRAPNSQMRRYAIVDPDEPIRQSRGHSPDSATNDYWSPQINMKWTARNKPLKNPKNYDNPNVVDPHTVAFADFHHVGDGETYLDYVTSRQRGHGHARRLIEEIANQHQGRILNFGRVMNEGIWRVKEDLESRGHQTQGHKDF